MKYPLNVLHHRNPLLGLARHVDSNARSMPGRRIFDLSLTFSDFSSINTMETVIDILTNAETATPEQPAKHANRYLKAVKDKDLRFMGRFVHEFGEDIARYSIWRHINKCPVLLTNQQLLAAFPQSMTNSVDQIIQGLLAKTNSAFILTTDGSRVQYYQSLVRHLLLNPIHCLNRVKVDVKSATKPVLTFDDKYKSLGLPHLRAAQAQKYHLKDPFVLRTKLRSDKCDSQTLVFMPKDAATLGAAIIESRPGRTEFYSDSLERNGHDNTLLSVDYLLAYMECLEQEGKCAFTVALKRLLLLIQDAKMARDELEEPKVALEPSPKSIASTDSLQYWKTTDGSSTLHSTDAWSLDLRKPNESQTATSTSTLTSSLSFDADSILECGHSSFSKNPERPWLGAMETQHGALAMKGTVMPGSNSRLNIPTVTEAEGGSRVNHGIAELDSMERWAYDTKREPPNSSGKELLLKEQDRGTRAHQQPLLFTKIYRLSRNEIEAFEGAAKRGPAMRTPIAIPRFGIDANYAELDEYTLLSQLMHNPVSLRRFKVITAFRSNLYRRYMHLARFCRAIATSTEELIPMVSNDDNRRIARTMELYFDRFFGKLMLNGENGCQVAEAWLIDVLQLITKSTEPVLSRENEETAIRDFKSMVNECIIILLEKKPKKSLQLPERGLSRIGSPIEELRAILENPHRKPDPLEQVSRLIRKTAEKDRSTARRALAS